MEARAAQQIPAQTGRFKTFIILFSCENFRDGFPDSTGSARRSARSQNKVMLQFVVEAIVLSAARGLTMALGVIFGFYPARKAARMNPIDTLRFE